MYHLGRLALIFLCCFVFRHRALEKSQCFFVNLRFLFDRKPAHVPESESESESAVPNRKKGKRAPVNSRVREEVPAPDFPQSCKESSFGTCRRSL